MKKTPKKYRNGLRTVALVAIASLAMLQCGGGPDTQTKTYALSPNQIANLMTLTHQTMALAGRLSALPDGLDFEAPALECPTNGEERIQVDVAGCNQSENGLVCILQEQYDCPVLAGEVTGTITNQGTAVKIERPFDGYTEGNITLAGLELEYNGAITVSTDVETASVEHDLKIVLREANSSPSLYPAEASYSVTPGDDEVIVQGWATLGLGTIGTATVEFDDVAYSTDSEQCAGLSGGRFVLDFARAETAVVSITTCNTAIVSYLNTYSMEPEETLNLSSQEIEGWLELSYPDIINFRNAPQNANRPSAIHVSGNQYWCRLLGGVDDPFQYMKAAPAASTFETSIYTECMILLDNPNAPPPYYTSVALGNVAFDGRIAIETSSILAAEFGQVTQKSADEVTFERTHTAATEIISDLTMLEPGLLIAAGVSTPTDFGLPYNPWFAYSQEQSPQLMIADFNHFGAWLDTSQSGTAGAQFFKVSGAQLP